MSPEDRFQSVVFAAVALGPIIPFFGIVDGRCECGKPEGWINPFTGNVHKSGKHGAKGYKEAGTRDYDEIKECFREYPNANYAVLQTDFIVLDLDIRPDKNGVQYLAERGELPKTVSVETGSGGKHLYFKIPPDVENYRSLGQHGIDLIRNHVVMAPGSLHISGNYYQWSPGLSPDDVPELAELPSWILDLLRKPVSQPRNAPSAIGTPKGTLSPLDDQKVILKWIKHLNPLGPGGRSARDFRDAMCLAFWCGHRREQFDRIWAAAPGQPKRKFRAGSQQEATMLDRAFNLRPDQNWTPKEKPKPKKKDRPLDPSHPFLKLAQAMRASKAKGKEEFRIGRPKSDATKSVLDLRQRQPELTQAQIASRLSLKLSLVKKIYQRNR